MSLEDESFIEEIESLAEIKSVATVLKLLEKRGLKQPAIASGWIRGYITGSTPSDIDVAYVGDIHYLEARRYLMEILEQLKLDKTPWDIDGIWNTQMEFPEITTTEQNYLLFYVDSIDSVYLASDGKLHDPTGFGITDAREGVLRMNDFQKNGFSYPDGKIVYLCLEGCRRIAKFGWKPTNRSKELISSGVNLWSKLSLEEKEYFFKKIKKKYQHKEHPLIRPVYKEYGWDCVFEEV